MGRSNSSGREDPTTIMPVIQSQDPPFLASPISINLHLWQWVYIAGWIDAGAMENDLPQPVEALRNVIAKIINDKQYYRELPWGSYHEDLKSCEPAYGQTLETIDHQSIFPQ